MYVCNPHFRLISYVSSVARPVVRVATFRLKLLDSTKLSPSGRYNYIRPLPMVLEWMSTIRADGCAAMGDGVHLTVDQLHLLSLMRGEWDRIAKRTVKEPGIWGGTQSRGGFQRAEGVGTDRSNQ